MKKAKRSKSRAGRRGFQWVLLLLAAVALHAEGWLLPLSERQQYSVAIEARGAELTGICIVKTDAEGSRGADEVRLVRHGKRQHEERFYKLKHI